MSNELSIFEPRVLNGVIREFEGPEQMVGHQLVGTPEHDPAPTWEYDIEREARGAQLSHNSYGSEARIVDQLPYGHLEGGYAYLRDKKQFNPTTLRWLREAGKSQLARGQAERRVTKELQALRMEHLRSEEIAIWAMLTGSWAYTLMNGATVTVNYRLPAAHTPTVGTDWGAGGDDPVGDLFAWKRVVSRASGFPIRQAWLNGATFETFYNLAEVSANLSDVQRDKYRNEGMVPRFLGIDWFEYDGGYQNAAGTFVPYIPDERIIFIAPGGTDNLSMNYGPSADLGAPEMHTGPFTKSWDEEDPSGRQFLLEQNYMPFLKKPFQILTADTTA